MTKDKQRDDYTKLAAYFSWSGGEQKRVSREWSNFNGTHLAGVALADRQTDRLEQAIERMGCAEQVKRHYSAQMASDAGR